MMNTIQKDNSSIHIDLDIECLIAENLRFWFYAEGSLRSPFPAAIRDELEVVARKAFHERFLEKGNEDAIHANPEEVIESFELILFNEAIKLVDDPDQQLTLAYPFMPRTGDLMQHKDHGEGVITARTVVQSQDGKNLFQLEVNALSDQMKWQTVFELPA